MGSAERIKHVARLVSTRGCNIIVLSAMAGTTNTLVDICNYLYKKNQAGARETVNAILAEHPTISVILDIHRDAIQRDETTIVAPVAEIGGRQCAQVMVIAGCDDGTLNIPNWRQNLRFAAELLNQMEADWPTLTRPLFFAHRKYNQDMAPTALLIEVGSSGNTFEEAEYAAQLTGRSLCKVLKRMEE